jgi:CRP-like cAMP-binding protein
MGLLGQGMQGNFAETAEDSLVRVTTTEQVKRLLKSDPDFALRILQLVGNRLNELEERFVQIAYSPASARMAHLLLANMDPATGAVEGLTHAEIGDTIGALRQTVTEILASFKRRGLVTTGCRRICILDRPGLKSLTMTAERP